MGLGVWAVVRRASGLFGRVFGIDRHYRGSEAAQQRTAVHSPVQPAAAAVQQCAAVQ